MKFSHTLSLNANPDWEKHYVDYASLKKLINEVSTKGQQLAGADEREPPHKGELAGEGQALFDENQNEFLIKLMEEVTSVREFYYKKLAELNRELARLKPMLEKSASYLDLSGETSSLIKSRIMKSLRNLQADSENPNNSNVNLEDIRREICDSYTQYSNLQTYASLNCTAVRKILKKYDKAMHTSLLKNEMDSFKAMLPFWDGTPEIERSTDILQQYFAHFFCKDDSAEGLRRLQLMVRELVSFQRRSVWLDVIQDQRRHESAQMVPVTEKFDARRSSIAKFDGEPLTIWQYILSSGKIQMGIFCFFLFFFLLFSPHIFPNDPIKKNSLALLIFSSLLWAGEVFPLFVTSMLVPFLVVILRVIVVDGIRLDAHATSKHVFGTMFSHVIMLLIGGFSIAAALSKHNIAKVMASSIAVRCGSEIRVVLLVNMFVATIASMWISNVAAPVLCYSLVAPILKAASAEVGTVSYGTKQQNSAEYDHRLCRALVMGIALASNVGGMASPISSPQNLFAIEYTPIGWLAWFTVSIPLCIILNVTIWGWLIYCFDLPASTSSSAVERALQRSRSSNEESFTMTQYFVMIVSGGVVLLWCASVAMESLTGQMGVLGIVPFVLFFGTNVLTKEDLNNFLWSIVILAMGGLVLGNAVESSGLLDVMAKEIASFIEIHSLNIWSTMCVFTLLILICTTFVSHTVGAIVVLPILDAIGSQMVPSHAKELVFAGALACSAAMGLPVSGFPNMTAVSQEDHLGNRFLTTMDFIKYAIPASLLSWAVLTTVGYSLILVASKM